MKRLVLVSALFLAACGGGGGGSSTPTPPVVVTPPPTVSVALSAPKIKVGESAVLTWSSTGATSCTGLDGLAGIKPISGTETITASKGGQYKYTISCDGAGGTFKQTAALAVPYPVQRTSYLNFKNINIGPQTMPRAPSFRGDEAITAGHSYGDFFQDGSISMIAASNVFAGVNGFGSIIPGSIYFFKKDAGGNWVDNTSTLLSSADRTGCLSPRKVVVADFNGDTKPDAFISCHGIDGNLPPGKTSGENPRFILSQTDGTYKNTDAGFNCYCHGAAAADFSGDGFADIVIADPPVFGRVVYLKNNRNGTFTDTPSAVPASTTGKSIWSVEFVDMYGDNKFDLALFGYEDDVADSLPSNPWEWQPTFFINDGANRFSDAGQVIKLPFVKALVWDVIVENNKIVFLRTFSLTQMQIQVYDVQTLNLTAQYFEPERDTAWFTVFNGKISGAYSTNAFSHPF